MYGSQTFDVTQEVTIEVSISEVMESIDHDALADALVQDGYDFSDIVGEMDADDVLNGIAHSAIVSYAASEVDSDTLLDAIKESDPDGLTGWLEDNRDVLPVDVKTETPMPEPIPLVRPVVSMNEGRVLVAGRADSLESLSVFDAGMYTTFNGMLYVDAIGVKFVVDSTQSAEAILGAVAFAQANLSKEV